MKKISIIALIMLSIISCSQEPKIGLKLEKLEHMKESSRKTVLQIRLDNLEETAFRFPCGDEIGTGYYNAQGFQDNVKGDGTHLAWDINGLGGGNSDLGDTLYAISPGIVAEVEESDYLTIYHKYNDSIVKVLYYHMYKPMVKAGQDVYRGQPIALMGNTEGAYYAHLHLEVMKDTTTYEMFYGDPIGHLDPTILFPNFKPKR